MNRLIIGLGSGRCGTMSLAKLLNLQQDCHSLHEPKPRPLPWHFDEKFAREHLACIRRPEKVVAVTAFFYLSYVEWIEQHAGCPVIFVCLQRNLRGTVRSFTAWTDGSRLPPSRNHWMKHDGTRWTHTKWDRAYPKYKATSKKAALVRYYEDYYRQAKRLAGEKSNFRIFPMRHLNHKDRVRELLKFCGFDRPEVKVGIRIHHKLERPWF